VTDLIQNVLHQLPNLALLSKVYLVWPKHDYGHLLISGHLFSHACMTPLTVIRCSAEKHLTKVRKLSKDQDLKNIILATQQIENLLAYIKNDRRRRVIEDGFLPDGAIKQAAILIKAAYPTSTLKLSLPEGRLLKLLGPQILFQEAICCLVKNALQAYGSTQQRVVDVVLSVKTSSSNSGAIVSPELRQSLNIQIVDYGCGMNRLELILAQAKGVTFRQNGSGLGLPFAREVFERVFGGSMRVESRSGHGTRIIAELPVIG
jgi:signal transduction histidine kinase